MQRVVAIVECKTPYIDTPREPMRRGLDYTYRAGTLLVYGHGLECLQPRVENARRIRRQLRKGSVEHCEIDRIKDVSGIECDTILYGAMPPSPHEILLTFLAARLYRLFLEGRLSFNKVARLYETASCSVVEGGYLWYQLEEIIGRKALRMIAARYVKTSFERAHIALAPVYRGGRVSIKRARCYTGVVQCHVIYELLLPEELEPNEEIKTLSQEYLVAAGRLAEELGVGYERVEALRMGVGVWPLSSIVAVAWLAGRIGGAAVETIFAAYKRCSGVRLWPPNRVDRVVYNVSEFIEPGVVKIDVKVAS